MANKFPINQTFQRLSGLPLDSTEIFDTLKQAEDYAMNGPTSYVGQVVYVKDVRSSREIQENAIKKDGLFIIDQFKLLKPFFRFVLSTLQTDSGSGLSYDGIIVDNTDISNALGNVVSGEIQNINNELEELANEFNDYKDHTHEIRDIENLESSLDDLQDEINDHTHTANDIDNFDNKVDQIVNNAIQNIRIPLDEDKVQEIIDSNNFVTAVDISQLQVADTRNETLCRERYNETVEAFDLFREEINNLLNEHIEVFESHVEDFENHYHTISDIRGDNDGDYGLKMELDLIKADIITCNEKIEANYEEFLEFKATVEQQMGDIAALLDEINGEII